MRNTAWVKDKHPNTSAISLRTNPVWFESLLIGKFPCWPQT